VRKGHEERNRVAAPKRSYLLVMAAVDQIRETVTGQDEPKPHPAYSYRSTVQAYSRLLTGSTVHTQHTLGLLTITLSS